MIADKRALNQILINLLSNAIRFTERGGKIAVSASAEAGYITFVVEDNGVGINEEDLARVGEPYFQARRQLRPPPRRHRSRTVHRQGAGAPAWRRTRHPQPRRCGHACSVRLPLDCERAEMAKARALPAPIAVTNYFAGQSPHKAAARATSSAAASAPDTMTVKKSA